MLTNKSNMICTLQILREYSDKNHILTMREIIGKMKSVYNMKVDHNKLPISLLEILNYVFYC